MQSTLSISYSPFEPVTEYTSVEDGEIIVLEDTVVRVMHTPGHSEGSVCFFIDSAGVMFSGDTLFSGSIGRTDFIGSDNAKMKESLRKIAAIEGEYKVMTGHGGSTLLSREKALNPFFRSM